MAKQSKKVNSKHLGYLCHCINFNHFARTIYLKIKNKKLRESKIGLIIMNEDLLSVYMEKFNKTKSFNKKDLKGFVKIYNFLSTLYETDFRSKIDGKPFDLEFDYSEKK